MKKILPLICLLWVCIFAQAHAQMMMTNINDVRHSSAPTFQAATGVLTEPASTGNASVTGLSFQPKVVLLYTTGVSALTQSLEFTMGACQSSTARWTVGGASTTNTASGERNFKSTKCFSEVNPSGTILSEADFVSQDSGGFTVNFSTVTGSTIPIYYIALGGSALNASVGTFNSGSGTGSQAITGLGFQPSTVFIGNSLSSTTDGPTGSMMYYFGMGESSTERFAEGQQISSGSDENTSQISTAIMRRWTAGASVNGLADLTSLDSGGFTINFTTNTAARKYGYIALGGIHAKAGTFNQNTSTGNQSITGMGFQPSVVIALSRGLVSSTTIDLGAQFNMGAAVSSTARNTASLSFFDNGSTISSGMNSSASAFIQNLTAVNGSNPTVATTADFVSQDADGFTINWTTADATARQIIYWGLAP